MEHNRYFGWMRLSDAVDRWRQLRAIRAFQVNKLRYDDIRVLRAEPHPTSDFILPAADKPPTTHNQRLALRSDPGNTLLPSQWPPPLQQRSTRLLKRSSYP
jgi:hypothetical protein